jgi:biopolymer transport protein ExbD/biopolymer transport protein TolR
MNVTPLVDVVLVLLIIFMVVAPQLDQDVQVNLPGIFNPDPEVEGNMDPLKVSVAKPGEYHIDEQQFDLQGVLDYLATQRTADPDRRLLLRADSTLKYVHLREFMSRVQQMGFPGLNFMVGEKHHEGAVRATADYGGREVIDEGAPAGAGTGEPGAAPPATPPATGDAPAGAAGS